MSYSCSDFTGDVLNCLVSAGAIEATAIPQNSPGDQSDMAVEAIVKMHRSVLASRFIAELLAGAESMRAIGARHGSEILAFLFYLQAAISDEKYVEVTAHEMAAVELIRTLPSAEEWLRHVHAADPQVLSR